MFPKIRGTILGVPIRRTIVFLSILGSPYFGKLPYEACFSLGLFWGYVGVIFGIYWGYIRVILGLYWGNFGL